MPRVTARAGRCDARSPRRAPGAEGASQATVQRVARAENADRETLYKEIAAAEGVDNSQIPRIRETYAETLRKNARRGDWIQSPGGEWKQKK